MEYLIKKNKLYYKDKKENIGVIDIGINNTYPGNMLSNFYPHKFSFNNIICNSMEGLLQSFKIKNKDEQIYVCSLIGYEAKKYTKKYNNEFYNSLILYWDNKQYFRLKNEYQKLLKLAYKKLFLNKDFHKALKDTNNIKLIHSIGKKYKHQTILTEDEFINRLYLLRDNI